MASWFAWTGLLAAALATPPAEELAPDIGTDERPIAVIESERQCNVDDPAPECGPGAWLGPLSICSDMTATTRLSVDEWSGLPVLIIDLDERLHAALAELTAGMIAKPLPLRIDGRTIIAPYVNEPITKGSLQVTGPDMKELNQVQASLARCAEAPDQNKRVSE